MKSKNGDITEMVKSISNKIKESEAKLKSNKQKVEKNQNESNNINTNSKQAVERRNLLQKEQQNLEQEIR